MIDWLMDSAHTLAANPLALVLVIILATFILEDAATIGASLLAVSGVISPGLALFALYVGIVLGDLALYGLGLIVKLTGWTSVFIHARKLVGGRRWLRKRFVPALIGARFTPGMRLPTYVASGFLRLSFLKFTATILVVAAVWTGSLFALIYVFGEVAGRYVGDRIWILGLILIAGAIITPWLLARNNRAGSSP